MYRHGDLLIVPGKAKTSPASQFTSVKSAILERGETTGHAHVLESKTPFETHKLGGNVIGFDLKSPAKLKHEEHETITIPEGEYYIIRQKEFTDNDERTVRD